jgi:hypothetical protein
MLALHPDVTAVIYHPLWITLDVPDNLASRRLRTRIFFITAPSGRKDKIQLLVLNDISQEE